MAGGEGTRLRPLTSNAPKPLLPLVNRPMMEHVVELLKTHGFNEIVVTLAFLPQAIRSYFGDGSEFGVRMVYATEETPLGTAGSVRNARDELDEPFLVISGDVLTDIDLGELVRIHHERGAMATLALKAVDNPLEFGIVITRPDGTIERFLEKPTWGQVFSDTVNTGIYVCDPRIFEYIAAGENVDFSGDVFPRLLEDGEALFGHVAGGYWEDVGTLESYLKVHRDVLNDEVAISVPGFRVDKNIWLGEGAEIDPDATVVGPAVIGDNCTVAAGAHVGAFTVLGSNVMVRSDAIVERSVIHDNAYLGNGVRLRASIIGRSSDLRDYARCEEGVVLGDNCFVGDHAVINPGVRVFPFKSVDSGAIVNSSIVWESRGARRIFTAGGVSGLANVDVTPELACRVAMAYATTMKKGATVTTSRDSSRAARAIKRAMMAGLNAAGVNVDDLALASVPVTRFHVGTKRVQGGLTVRLAAGDPQAVSIRFFDSDGIDINESDQRRIERAFNRQDFRRVFAADIGEISFPARTLDYYTAALIDTVDLEAVRRQAFTVVVDYAFGSTSVVMPTVLSKLGADVLAVNPYAFTLGAAAFDPGAHAARVAELVRTSGAQLGAVFDPDGERLTLVDDTGHVLTTDQSLLAMVALMADSFKGGLIALPVSLTAHGERIARDSGADVIWTKVAAAHVMDSARGADVVLAANGEGGFVIGDFLPAFDAVAAFVHILALLAASEQRLSEVVTRLPHVYTAHETVATPWSAKGGLMRRMIEHCADESVVLIDGVKVIHDDGWALMLPDPDEPVTHVWSEAPSDEAARWRARDYGRTVRQLLRNEGPGG